MGNGQDKDEDIENQIGEGEGEVEREHIDTFIAVLGLELVPKRRDGHALEGKGEGVGDAPGDGDADDDVVGNDEGADAEDAAEEEKHRELDQRQADGAQNLECISGLLVDGELRCVTRRAVGE